MDRRIISIDLKSFYASVELAARKYDPMTTNLVVADPSRTDKTICLAVSPSLKACGISGRARLFEVIQRVRQVNAERFARAQKLGLLPIGPDGKPHFTAKSFDAGALAADPSLELAYIVAPPRMRLYEEVSTKIFSIYSRYISPEDIHVYSIDECFLDVTAYLRSYQLSAHELAITMIREVLRETGITATAGIGTNLYLAKVAMDIVAKHVPPDKDGVRIAELDEMSYRRRLWCHTPLTDFWRVGRGTARTLERLGCRTMGDVARLSEKNESRLYDALGINAELLIDHAWGWEPTEIRHIKSYKPETTGISSGQVLMEPYPADKARLIVQEMTELLALDLVRKRMVTKKVELTVGYDRTSITPSPVLKNTWLVARTGEVYQGRVKPDPYGRPQPDHAHGTGNLDRWTSSSRRLMEAMTELYDRMIDPDLLVRRVYVVAAGLIPEDEIPAEAPLQLDLFTDYEALAEEKAREQKMDEKERKLQQAALLLQGKFGKNALLKGMNLQEGATTVLRNGQIGGHTAGPDPSASFVAQSDTKTDSPG